MRVFGTKCCLESCTMPLEYSCMWSEIVQSYCKLYERYDKVVTKRKQIWKLSEPKHKKKKYRIESKLPVVNNCKIEIVNKTDKTERTRTEQLAFPKLRQLAHLKSQPSFSSFNNTRKSGVNRLLRKGILSVYSRLQNIIPEERPPQPKTWSTENNSKLKKRLKTLALPKKNYCDMEKKSKSRNRGEGPKIRRIRKLSKPKIYKAIEPNEWIFTKAMQDFKPTERLLKMSQPKKYEQNYDEVNPFQIRQNVLNYKATPRIKALAEPAKSKGKIEERSENPFQTNSRALKAVASKRIVELASPRDYADMQNREDAFRVSRRALRAKATARLLQLAEPKKR